MTQSLHALLSSWFIQAGIPPLPATDPQLSGGKLDPTPYHLLPPTPDVRLSRTVDGHHEVAADAWIFDQQLGSLGLVHELVPGPNLPGSVTNWIEDAAYIRHLMGVRRSGLKSPLAEFLPTIELVFLIRKDAPEAAAVLATVRDQLRALAATGGLLHAISVNIGEYQPELAASLDRPFCWLLPKVRAWFKTTNAQPREHRPWTSLVLENFRCETRRTWRPRDGFSLHVLHGPNGSGKSSLAEAFEFAVTGQSTRLGPPDAATPDPVVHFRPLICQRSPHKPARVTLQEADGSVHTRTVPSTQEPNPGKPLVPDLPGNSFRLDQVFCDRMATLDPTQRMRLWLETFFQRHDRDRRDRLQADQSIRELVEKLLPPQVVPRILERLSLWHEPAQTLLRGEAVSLASFLSPGIGELLGPSPANLTGLELHIPRALDRPLRLLERDDGQRVFHPRQQEEWIGILREALEADRRWAEACTDAIPADVAAILRRLGEDTFEGPSTEVRTAEEDARQFLRWQHLVARVELLDHALVLATTLDPLSLPDTDLLSELVPRPGIPVLLEERARAIEERDRLRPSLAAFQGTPGPDAATTRTQRSRATQADIDSLVTMVARGVLAPTLPPDRAEDLRVALEQRQRREFGPCVVGTPGWTDWMAERIRAIQQVVPLLTPAREKGSRPPAIGRWAQERAEQMVRLVAALVDRARLDANAASVFLQQVERHGLGDAMVELLALMTPARWAYQPVQVQVQLGEPGGTTQDRFDMRVHELEVRQTLNTAELNTLALVLFLLCAPHVANPWRTLFLDDPLQNMDELTVTAVARALAKLQRVWKHTPNLAGWSTVLLLHGEEDCERILLEAPGAFYRIPWLAPVNASESAAQQQEIQPAPAQASGGADARLMDFIRFAGAWPTS